MITCRHVDYMDTRHAVCVHVYDYVHVHIGWHNGRNDSKIIHRWFNDKLWDITAMYSTSRPPYISLCMYMYIHVYYEDIACKSCSYLSLKLMRYNCLCVCLCGDRLDSVSITRLHLYHSLSLPGGTVHWTVPLRSARREGWTLVSLSSEMMIVLAIIL